MTSRGSKSRIKWEGNSQEEIRSWPKDVRANIGLELHRLDNHEEPLDSKSMGKSMPGVHEIRDQDANFWYRLLYGLYSGWIYVLHCFTKKTAKTSKVDRKIALDRLAAVKRRNDPPAQKEKENSA